MSVFRDHEISWMGKRYTFTPSNRLLRRIEGQLAPSSFVDIINRMRNGKTPVSEVAFVVAEFLRAAGADDVSEDDIYGAIQQDFVSNNGEGFTRLAQTVILVVSPAEGTREKFTAAFADPE